MLDRRCDFEFRNVRWNLRFVENHLSVRGVVETGSGLIQIALKR